MDILTSMVWFVLVDALFVVALLVAIVPLALYRRAAYAVLKRNFVGYFSNPTGYVFLCLFVLLTSFGAFWPADFFASNLANLAQLSKYLPMIMLVFIPAITMSIWSEERRQGTDELLLTLPATDFDIVIGKYLAAAAIFTCSLLFSQLANFAVLATLADGDLDGGLLLSTYLGYWLTGMAMLAIGMVASFLTSNLTVGFVLGVVFNTPLVFASLVSRTTARFSLDSYVDDLGRGVISSSSMIYFFMIIFVGLYLSMVLIGRRHWTGGRDGHAMVWHYVARSVALVAIAIGASYFMSNHDWLREDVTEGKVSSLSDDSRRLIRELNAKNPIRIDAYLSGHVPELYVKTRTDLLSMLKEFQKTSGSQIVVNINDDLEAFSEQAELAKERFGIEPQSVLLRERGKFESAEVIMGAAFQCGLEKVVVPFFDFGVPVEYELVRSISTVAKGHRKRLGVVKTDASLFGGFDPSRFQQIPKQLMVQELEKQYDVSEVVPTAPIDAAKYDVLMVAQPSSLTNAELDNVISAIKQGLPTAIFEDPRPMLMQGTPTGERKQPPGGMFGGGGPPPEKCDIRKLWNVLGIEVRGVPGVDGLFQPDLVWHQYNPYRKIEESGQWNDLWVIVRKQALGGDKSFNDDNPITKGLDELLFIYAGNVEPAKQSSLKFQKLVSTGIQAGTLPYDRFTRAEAEVPRERPDMLKGALRSLQGLPSGEQILAARVHGRLEEDKLMAQVDDASKPGAKTPDEKTPDAKPASGKSAGDAKTTDKAEPEKKDLDVIYVSDIDVMSPAFLRIRAQPDQTEELNFQFENVTFMLNIIDALSHDDDYIDIRKRKTRHSTLKLVERITQRAREVEQQKRKEHTDEFNGKVQDLEEQNSKEIGDFNTKVKDLERRNKEGEDVYEEYQALVQRRSIREESLRRQLEVERETQRRKMTGQIETSRRQADLQIASIQDQIKLLALAAAIPPVLVGGVVFVWRRLREREGVSKTRLR